MKPEGPVRDATFDLIVHGVVDPYVIVTTDVSPGGHVRISGSPRREQFSGATRPGLSGMKDGQVSRLEPSANSGLLTLAAPALAGPARSGATDTGRLART
jgi:hypothetical protein